MGCHRESISGLKSISAPASWRALPRASARPPVVGGFPRTARPSARGSRGSARESRRASRGHAGSEPHDVSRFAVFAPGRGDDNVELDLLAYAEIAASGPAAAHVAGGNMNIFAQASRDRKSTRLNSSHLVISYAVFCLKKKK